MSAVISRKQFLRGDFFGRKAPLRPPWAAPEGEFTQQCDRCGDCVTRCPTSILQKGPGGYPVVDFTRGECLFCGDCADACRPGAIKTAVGSPWSVLASIDTGRCLAFQGVECRSCFDPCEARAIRMQLTVGGVARPQLDTSACTGCGACFSVCPVQAVSLTSGAQQQETI